MLNCSRVRRSAVSTLAIAMALVGCANATTSPHAEGTKTVAAIDLSPKNWTNTIGGLPTTDSKAAADVPFSPMSPQGLGDLGGTYETDPSEASPSDRVLEYDFPKSSFGPVVVLELSPEVPLKEWHGYVSGLVEQNGSPLMHGIASSFAVRGGAEALLTTSEDGIATDIRWLDQDSSIEIWVRGPALTVDQCVKIADGL